MGISEEEAAAGALAGDLLDSPEAGGAVIRGGALRAAGFVVISLLSLLSAPLLTRHLGVVRFGRYAQVVSLVALVGTVTEAGLGALGIRELAVLEPARRDALMRNLLGIRLVLTVMGIAFAMAFAALAGYGSSLVVGTLLAGIGLLTYVGQATFALPLGAFLRLGWVTIGDVLRQVVFVATIVALVLAGGGLVPLLGSPIPAGLVAMALMVALARRTVPWRPAFHLAQWRRILRDTLPLAAASAIYSVYFRLVILLMSVLATGLQTGLFALSFRVIEVVVTVPGLLVGSVLPLFSRAARDDEDRFSYGVQRTLDVAVIAGAGLTLMTFVGAPLAIDVLTGHAGGGAVPVLRIQSFTLVLVFIDVTYGLALIALRRHRALIVVNAITLAVAVTAAAILIAVLDARGGAIATLVGEASLAVGYGIALARARAGALPHLGIAARAIGAALAAGALAELVHVPRVPNLGALVVAGLAYAALVLVLRAVPPELWVALRLRRAPAG